MQDNTKPPAVEPLKDSAEFRRRRALEKLMRFQMDRLHRAAHGKANGKANGNGANGAAHAEDERG